MRVFSAFEAWGRFIVTTSSRGAGSDSRSVSIVDVGTGLWAVLGILASVIARAGTGRGGRVATSLYETALAWMGVPGSAYLASRTWPRRRGPPTPRSPLTRPSRPPTAI